MKKLTLFIFLLVILSITVLGTGYLKNTMAGQPPWIHNLQMRGEVDSQTGYQIKDALWERVTPYKDLEYENATISFLDQGRKIRVKFMGTSDHASDIYEFLYDKENKELTTAAYLLELIPLEERSRMVTIASMTPEVSGMLKGKSGEPTVRRILPETAKDYYAPKTLISVTWSGDPVISALIDPETGVVVKTWSSTVEKGK